MTKSLTTNYEVVNGRLAWTVDGYHRAIDAGIFGEDDRLELLFGEIIPKMPVGEPHTQCLKILNLRFVLQFRQQYYYQVQDPIALLDDSEPEPDYAIVTHKSYSRRTGQPSPEDVHLLIEVADTSLEHDRGFKAKAYALAGIKEYWIINLRDRQVEVHLQPNTGSGTYASVRHHEESTTFDSPFCGPTRVTELLPEAE